jgi:hypothetical protein
MSRLSSFGSIEAGLRVLSTQSWVAKQEHYTVSTCRINIYIIVSHLDFAASGPAGGDCFGNDSARTGDHPFSGWWSLCSCCEARYPSSALFGYPTIETGSKCAFQ